MSRVTIELGNGYTAVFPDFPEKLVKQLTYWHRTLERRGGTMVATGENRPLYYVDMMNQDGQYGRRLTTSSGFSFRIKQLLQEDGYDIDFIDKRTPFPAPDYRKALTGLREYQYPCAYVALESGGGVIACPTGWGKTHIIAALINAYSHEELLARNTPLVVVATPEKDITFKDYNDLVGLLPDRDVGLVMSGHKRSFSDDVQVITLDSLHHLQTDDVGIIIVDEVHTASSERRSDTILSFTKARRWGVSATPDGRFDGRDLVTEGLFGPVVYRRTYAQGIKDGALVPIKVFWVKAPEPHIGLTKYMDFSTRAGKYRNGVDRNQGRNEIIASLLKRTPDELQQLCIMPHLDQMNRLIPLCDGVKYVHGTEGQEELTKSYYDNLAPVTKQERRAIYADMYEGKLRKVLSTYVYKQGVNFPELAVIINAGGGGSDIVAQQIPGRESRNIDGKTESYLIEFWHEWDTETNEEGKSRPGPIHRDDLSREACYTELGFNQVWLDKIDDLPFLKK